MCPNFRENNVNGMDRAKLCQLGIVEACTDFNVLSHAPDCSVSTLHIFTFSNFNKCKTNEDDSRMVNKILNLSFYDMKLSLFGGALFLM